MGSYPNSFKEFNFFNEDSDVYVNPLTARETTKLHYAAHDGDCDRIEECMKMGFDIEARDAYGRTPLLRAALKGHIDAFDLLLRYGADFDAHDDWQRYSEHLAGKEGHYDMLERIMEWGGEEVLKSQDNFGRTPLHLAALKARMDALHSIISTECDVNVRDKWHRTPLHLARKEGNVQTSEFLEKYGADRKCVDLFGKTPNEMN